MRIEVRAGDAADAAPAAAVVGADAARGARIARAARAGELLVAHGDGALIGVAIAAPHFFGRTFVELVAVAAPARRQGVATALLRGAVAAAASSRVFTSTNASNAPMRRLLEREGWRFCGQLDGLDDDDPELFFHRDQPGERER